MSLRMESMEIERLETILREKDESFCLTVYTKGCMQTIVNIYHKNTLNAMTLDLKNLDWLSLGHMRDIRVYAYLTQLALRIGIPGSAIYSNCKVGDFIQRVQKRRHNRLARWVLRRWRDLLKRRWALCRDAWEVWMMRAARPGEGKLYLYWANHYEKTTREYTALKCA